MFKKLFKALTPDCLRSTNSLRRDYQEQEEAWMRLLEWKTTTKLDSAITSIKMGEIIRRKWALEYHLSRRTKV